MSAVKSPLKIFFDSFVPLLEKIARKINLSTELKNEIISTAKNSKTFKNERLTILSKLFTEHDTKADNSLNGLSLIADAINNEEKRHQILKKIVEICGKMANSEQIDLKSEENVVSDAEIAICKNIFAKISAEKTSFLKDKNYFERFYSQNEVESTLFMSNWEFVLNGILEETKNLDEVELRPLSKIISKIQFVFGILGNKNLNLSDDLKNLLLELALVLFVSSSDKEKDISEQLMFLFS